MKKRWIWSAAAVISALAAFGTYFTNQIMYMKKKDPSLIKAREIKAKRWVEQDFDELPKESAKVRSPFGYTIDCLFVTPHDTNKWMIFCHGVTENKYNSIRFMNLFLKKGFNAVLYDHRRHGDSGGKTSSYGFYEKEDLAAVIAELKRRCGDGIRFGIHGESMGAATTLLYAGSIRDDGDFYIADCPFSTFEEQVMSRLKAHVPFMPPKLLLPIGNLFLKWRDGYEPKDVSPLAAVENIHKPVLFIHTEQDDFIPAEMTRQLYDAKHGPKQLLITRKGGHAQAFNDNPAEYEAAIDEFLHTYLSGLMEQE
ncbi:MAG: alpha/beta hydrolase [Bacillus sp. (in: firmicutes)]